MSLAAAFSYMNLFPVYSSAICSRLAGAISVHSTRVAASSLVCVYILYDCTFGPDQSQILNLKS